MSVNLKDYVCLFPFNKLQIHRNENFVCCPEWLKKSIPHKDTIAETWNSDEIVDIRKSILDGSYKYCDDKHCPYLGDLLNFGIETKSSPLIKKTKTNRIFNEDGIVNEMPINLELNFDETCNYQCPSCRPNLIVSNANEQKRIFKKLNEIETFAENIQSIYSSTTGDPFASVPIRKFFQNFNHKKYKTLKNIHLHTNGSLWDEKMWNSMSSIHPYVHTCEISIDAATKDTYENKTRLGGNWDTLIDNLKFISTIPTFQWIKCSFIVQNSNYKEMEEFVTLIKLIFGKRGEVFFCRLQDWKSFTDKEYKNQEVNNPSHPNHLDFVKEFNKVCFNDYVRHNLHEYMVINKKII